jgi:hypothetical protein
MRLNFNNIGKGIEAIAGAKQAEDLAKAAKPYENNITEGAYGVGLAPSLQNVIGVRDEALQGLGEDATPEQRQQVIDQYTPAMSELSRRVGLQGPDYTVGGYGPSYESKDAARMANAGLRSEALANVYRRYGDVERADALEGRALEMRRGLEAENRARTAEKRAEKQFETSQEEARLRINRETREGDQLKKLDEVDTEAGRFLTNRLTDQEGNVRAATPDDMLAQLQHRATLLQQKGLGKHATDALKDYQSIAVNAIQLQTAERNDELVRVSGAVSQGIFKPAAAFYDKFIHDGAKTTDIVENKDGSITVSRVRDDGVALPDTKIKNKEELLVRLNSFKDPLALYNYSKDQFDQNMKVKQLAVSEGQLKVSQGQLSVAEGQLGVSQENLNITREREDRLAKPIQTMVEDLRGAGLDVSTADIKALAKLDKPESAAVKAQADAILKSIDPLQPKSLETAQAKLNELYKGVALQDRNKTIVQGLVRAKKDGNEETAIETLRSNGIGEDTIAGLAREAGITYTPSSTARPSAPASAPATAAPASGINTSRTGTVEANPYVNTAGKPTGLTTGAPSIASQVLPQVAQTVENTVGSVPAATRYLQGKIDRKEPLSTTETARAKMLGLIK